MNDTVPVIDINELHSPATLAAIDRACRDWGFFQITGHGIGRGISGEILAAARAFFALPYEEKQLICRDADNPWGYYDRELTKNRLDIKEIYDFGPGDGERLRPRWPAGLFGPRFESVVRAYYASCGTLAMRLLSAVAANLGVSAAYLSSAFERSPSSFLRLNHYPRSPHASAGDERGRSFGVGEHTDAGALTLLLQDEQPGLEVLRDSRWRLVEPRAGALVINIGDVVQVWSNDRYRAGLHRVITNHAADRYSIPFFLNPSYETIYQPLPPTVTALRPANYRPISWREFRGLRAAGDYADVGEEVQISHYRR